MKYFYFFALFFSLNSFSMESAQSFIRTNKGSTIEIKANFFRIDYSEKFIFYKLLNADVESKMSFKDFDFILIGKNKFKTYKLSNSNEVEGYFVLSETSSKTLIVLTKSGEEESNVVHYVAYILNANNVVVDSLEFDNLKTSKSALIRADIFSKINFYFKDCESLINRLSAYDKDSFGNLNLDILEFFNAPVYLPCL